jgi:hypothetical protein
MFYKQHAKYYVTGSDSPKTNKKEQKSHNGI